MQITAVSTSIKVMVFRPIQPMRALDYISVFLANRLAYSTRSSAIADGPRDAVCQLKFCQCCTTVRNKSH